MNGSVTIVTSGSRCVTIWPRDICAALFNATNSTIFTTPLIFLASHCFFWTHSKTWWMIWNSTFKTGNKGLRFSEKTLWFLNGEFKRSFCQYNGHFGNSLLRTWGNFRDMFQSTCHKPEIVEVLVGRHPRQLPHQMIHFPKQFWHFVQFQTFLFQAYFYLCHVQLPNEVYEIFHF